MYPFKRLMVGLDFSFMDEAVINYTHFLCRLLRPQAVYFVHVYRDLTDLDDMVAGGQHFQAPLDELLCRQMQHQVERLLPVTEGIAIHYEVREGQPTEELLRWSHIKQIDLFVSGLKSGHGGSGLAPQRFAMLSDCSVLLVPELAEPQLHTILIPVDFSEFSLEVVQQAFRLQQHLPDAQLMLQHVYQVPIGYYKTGKSYEEFADRMKFNAQKAYYRFCRQLQIKPEQLPCHFVLEHDGDMARAMVESVRQLRPGLLLMGSHGRTAVSSFFVGSVAEKVIREKPQVPTLVLKPKGKNMGLLEALFAAQ